jgi:hypothetical protein
MKAEIKKEQEPTTVWAMRMPMDLHFKVVEQAKKEDRSVNDQYRYIIRKALEKDKK